MYSLELGSTANNRISSNNFLSNNEIIYCSQISLEKMRSYAGMSIPFYQNYRQPDSV